MTEGETDATDSGPTLPGSGGAFRWGARSDVGQVRQVNQDSLLVLDGLFVVADGMGGHSAGEVASAIAVETMADDLGVTSLDGLVTQVRAANRAILDQAAADSSLMGMGTTICAIAMLDELTADGERRLGLVNVGDSRIYRFAEDRLEQVTEDHSLVETMVRDGQITADEALVHPQRNILTRALGIQHDVLVDYWELVLRQGDRFLLCSDGLFNEVDHDQITNVLREHLDPQEATDVLVRMANEHGARDNVTVVLVEITDGADAEPTPLPIAARVAGRPLEVTTAEVPAIVDELPTSPQADLDPTSGVDALAAPAAAPVVATDSAPAGAAPVPEPPPGEDLGDGRRSSVGRTLLFVLLVLAILGGALYLIGRYARDNYFVGFVPTANAGDEISDQLVVYQGRDGGVLWFDPTIAETTAFLRQDLTPAAVEMVDRGAGFDSVDDALAYIDELPLNEDVDVAPDDG